MDVLYSALGYESAPAPAPTLGCDEDDEAPAPTARRVYDDERNALVAPQRRGESNDTVRGAASSSAPMSAAASAAAAICAAASAAARRRAATSSFATPKAVPSFTPTPVGSPDDVVDDDRAEARPRRHMLELQRDGVLEHESAASSCVRRQPLFLILATTVGNALEWYDFALFGFLAPELGQLFFAPQDPGSALLETFAVFAAAFGVRPVGGLAIGVFSDRYGRRAALQLSVASMATATALIGVLPTYAQVGGVATLMLVACRLVQGLSRVRGFFKTTASIWELNDLNFEERVGRRVSSIAEDDRELERMIRACVLRLFRNTFRSSPLGNYREYVRDTSLERTANRYRLWGARSVAGQLIGALVFLVESAPKGHENLFGSLAFASGNAGTMLGGLAASVAKARYDPAELMDFGWRYPFLLSAVFGFVGYKVQAFAEESPEFRQPAEVVKARMPPVDASAADEAHELREHFKREGALKIAAVAGVCVLSPAAFYTFFIFAPAFQTTVIAHPLLDAPMIATKMLALSMLMLPLFGHLTDERNRSSGDGSERFLGAAATFFLVGSPVVFAMLSSGDYALSVLGMALATTAHSCYNGAIAHWLVTSFGTKQRGAILGLAWNVAAALIGGTSPAIAAYLVYFTGSELAPGFFISSTAAVALASLTYLNRLAASKRADSRRENP